jgi:hypothetical protein
MTSILRRILVLFLLSSLAIGQSGPVPATFFSLHENFLAASGTGNPDPPPTVNFGSFRTWDLNNCTWSEIETAYGVYNWTCLDSAVSLMQSVGVTDILYTVGYTPLYMTNNQGPQSGGGQFGSCYPPLVSGNTGSYDSTTVTDFVTALATRYNGSNGHGTISHYEAWNEPGYWCSTQAILSTHLQTVYNAVKAANPSATVNTPVLGISSTPSNCNNSAAGSQNLNSFIALNGTSNFDNISVHLYPYPVGGSPESSVGTQIANLWCGLNALGLTNKQVWNTEYAPEESVSPAGGLAAYVARRLLYEWGTPSTFASNYRISRNYWYSYDCCSGYGPSNLYSGGTITAAGTAWQQVYNWMVGSTMTSTCTLANGFYSCNFTESNGHSAQAVWASAWGTMSTQNYAISAGAWSDYRDLGGNTNTISNSATSVAVSEQPILLETASNGSPPPAQSPTPPTGLTAIVN